MVKISTFNFKVQHIKGAHNVVADVLFRMFSLPSEKPAEQICSVMLDFPTAFTEILSHQLNDEELGPIIENLK